MLPLPFPLLEGFLPRLGYRFSRRFVAVFWEPAGDEAAWTDGELTCTGADQGVVKELAGEPMVDRWLAAHQINLGNSDQPATHWLVVDQQPQRGYLADRQWAQDMVQTVCPAATC